MTLREETPAPAAPAPPRKRALPRLAGSRSWLLLMLSVLVAVLAAIGYVQWRQYILLGTASNFRNDGLGWSFSQLETEQLRLRNQLQLYLDDPSPAMAEKVQLRYDIFVSRLGLVDHERAAGMMNGQPGYEPAIAQVKAFYQLADQWLGPQAAKPFDLQAAQTLVTPLDALNGPLHDLSLSASHLIYQRAAERNDAVRKQAGFSIALTLLQCFLLLALGLIVLRQLRALTDRRRNLEALADTLATARQAADAANRAKSVFLANMSHEIRTPFHGMLGMMSLLQEGGLSSQQRLYLNTARESAHHLLAILNDILDISQLESGRLQVHPQAVDLPQLIAQVDDLMRVQAQAKGLTLKVDLAPDVPRWVQADPTRFKQILYNLLGNALKFTPSGGIELRVRTGAAPMQLVVEVADSGIGMDEALRARLFRRFTQGDASFSRTASGTGLGLEISRDLARLMGGDITVESAPGVGSTFRAVLPLPPAAPPPATSHQTESDPGAAPEHRLHVLVAEDHPVNRAYLEAVLEKLGHDAVFVLDGDGAVRAVDTLAGGREFDLVLMDLHMPGMDGFSAAKKIRALPEPRGSVPIVALTADAFQASRQLAQDAGMQGYLTKPAHLPQLREALARFARARQSEPLGTTPQPSPSDTLLDEDTISDVRAALGDERYVVLLRNFLAGHLVALGELRNAIDNAQFLVLRDRAHALKGSTASLGLKAVSQRAAELQEVAEQAPERAMPCFEQVRAVFEATLTECESRGWVVKPLSRAP